MEPQSRKKKRPFKPTHSKPIDYANGAVDFQFIRSVVDRLSRRDLERARIQQRRASDAGSRPWDS